MRKIIICALAVLMLTGCAKSESIFHGFQNYDRAIIELPGGEVLEVSIAECSERNTGWVIKSTDGKVYFVGAARVVMIQTEGENDA